MRRSPFPRPRHRRRQSPPKTDPISEPGIEDWLVLDFEGVGTLDATALDVLAELLERLAESGVKVVAVARANE